MRSSLVGIFLCLIALIVSAQEYPRKEVDLERLADELFGYQDLDLNYEDLYENLALLLANPININRSNPEELRFLNLMTEEQLQQLLRYRAENGDFVSIYELQAIPGFDLNTIYRIAPFLAVEDPNASISSRLWKRMTETGNNYFIVRYERTLQTKLGFTDQASSNQQFIGSEDKLYMRFRTSRANDFSFGFTMEKDAGEAVTWNPDKKQYGFDYNSFHFQLMNKGKIKNLIVGDFQSQVGQGMLLGGTFGFGKGGETITTVRRSNLGFMPYTSVNETGYLRGIALTYQLQPNLNLSGFYSNTWRDATLANDTTEDVFASSFQTTGLHRNTSELNRRKTINEQQYGAVLTYRKYNFDAGIIFNHVFYQVPVIRTPQPYNQFAFSGISQSNLGAYVNYTMKNFTWFTEAGLTINNGLGISSGILGSVTNQLDIVLHYRNYQRNFYSLYSNALAEGSIPINEHGLYWGWKYRWNRQFSLAGYADLFRFPWLRYRSYAPSDGHEFLVRLNYQPNRNVMMFVQFREESKVQNLSDSEDPLYRTDTGLKRNVWLNCDYGLARQLRMKSRVQFSSYQFNGNTTQGLALIQDVSADFGRISVTGRYSLFDTEDYDNRQYVYERDVWLAYSLPSYSGKGIRSYLLIQYDLNRNVSMWVRYSHTRFTDRETIGSGADTIDGDVRNDIKLQMRIRL
ncbi:MAG: helix-hairpin-helix domain-containing protein [Cyclobacteriaceae bacterium]|jgi:hypothetical protein|nr:helix-hairpin-helix domain-containing protein [Cyclobacteriaceae bacterium]